MLRELAPDLWVTARPLRFLGVEIGTRMSVIRLRSGLLLHSPVPLDATTRAQIDAIGRVAWIVAPNRFHHLFVADHAAAYHEARLLLAPGLPEKRPGLRFHAVLSDEPVPEWAGELEHLVFRAAPLFNEVVLLHRKSRSLILTDLLANVRRADSLVTRLVLTLDGSYGKLSAGRTGRLVIRDRKAGRRAIEQILTWDFDRIVLAHGEVVENGGREALREAFAWLVG